MFQSGNSVSVGAPANAMAAPPMALIAPSRLDGPSISLVAIKAKPSQGLGAIHWPVLRPAPVVPAPVLSESLLLLALCILLRSVAAKARQRPS